MDNNVSKIFDEYPSKLSNSIVCVIILFPLANLFISRQIKEMILLVKENKELIETIKSIIQVFPEGVLIRALDEKTKNVIMKFANDLIKSKLFRKFEEDLEPTFDKNLLIQVFDQNHMSVDEENSDISIDEFLRIQEERVLKSQIRPSE